MRFGPHTEHVEDLLAALGDRAVRRSPGRRRYAPDRNHRLDRSTYLAVLAAGRLEAWDDARTLAARAAVPSQSDDAGNAALALVASDLIDDAAWDYYTNTRLASRVEIRRPAGPLAERCACGSQLGQRLATAKRPPAGWDPVELVKPCRHTVASLPTAQTLDLAFGLVQASESNDWVQLIDAALLLAT